MSGIIAVIPYFSECKIVFYGINLKTFETKYNDITMAPDQLIVETVAAFQKCGFDQAEALLFIFKDGDLAQKSELAATFAQVFELTGTKFYCCSWNSILISATMMAFVDQNINDENVINKEMEYIFCHENSYTNFNVIRRSSNFYQINSIYNNEVSHFKNVVPVLTASKFVVSCFNDDEKQTITKKQIRTKNFIIDNLETKNVITLRKNISDFIGKAIVAKTLKLHEGKASKFDVANTGFQDFGIGTPDITYSLMINSRPQKEYMKKFLVKIASNEILPIKKTFVNYEKFEDLIIFEGSTQSGFIGYARFDTPEIGLAVTLSVDKYFKSNVEVCELSQLPKGNKSVDNVAMICIKDDKFTVATIKNGKFNKIVFNNVPLALGFVDNRILIGNEAIKLKETHNSSIITDFIKMLKTSASDLKADSKWGFEITKNENDEILLEFDTFRGRRKATPIFLFAFFIRYSIKAVEAISGQMPKTIVIVTKDLTDNFRNQLMASFKNAKLALNNNIQIHEYKIVEIND